MRNKQWPNKRVKLRRTPKQQQAKTPILMHKNNQTTNKKDKGLPITSKTSPFERLTSSSAEKMISNTLGKDVRLTFCERSPNPYSADDGKLIDIYVDDEGKEYWFDPDDRKIIQMGPHARQHQATLQSEPTTRLNVAQLRKIALALAAKAIPNFFERREYLHPLEDNQRARVYFFRWDDFSAPVHESEMPPFLQIALYADGRLASFTNTLR